jgi:hypothetical protein
MFKPKPWRRMNKTTENDEPTPRRRVKRKSIEKRKSVDNDKFGLKSKNLLRIIRLIQMHSAHRQLPIAFANRNVSKNYRTNLSPFLYR